MNAKYDEAGNVVMPVQLTGSNVELAAAGVATGEKDVGWASTLRLNIWGAPFSVKIEGQMHDGLWYTLAAADSLTGADVTSPITANGVYDFDVAGWQKVKATVTSGSVNVKGALLP